MAAECAGLDRRFSAGKVIGVKLGEVTRRVRIDGPFESIKESIKTAFGLRTKRPFWLEDDEGVVQTLSRDMPPGQYSLILDQGIFLELLRVLFSFERTQTFAPFCLWYLVRQISSARKCSRERWLGLHVSLQLFMLYLSVVTLIFLILCLSFSVFVLDSH